MIPCPVVEKPETEGLSSVLFSGRKRKKISTMDCHHFRNSIYLSRIIYKSKREAREREKEKKREVCGVCVVCVCVCVCVSVYVLSLMFLVFIKSAIIM